MREAKRKRRSVDDKQTANVHAPMHSTTPVAELDSRWPRGKKKNKGPDLYFFPFWYKVALLVGLVDGRAGRFRMAFPFKSDSLKGSKGRMRPEWIRVEANRMIEMCHHRRKVI
jgi:hypothetical protein